MTLCLGNICKMYNKTQIKDKWLALARHWLIHTAEGSLQSFSLRPATDTVRISSEANIERQISLNKKSVHPIKKWYKILLRGLSIVKYSRIPFALKRTLYDKCTENVKFACIMCRRSGFQYELGSNNIISLSTVYWAEWWQISRVPRRECSTKIKN